MDSILTLFQSTTDGACAVDARQRIVLWNDAAATLTGAGAASVVGRPCFDVMRCTDAGGRAFCRRHCPLFRAAQAAGAVPTTLLEAHPKVGRPCWLSVTTLVMPRRWRNSAVLVHLFRDVSRAKTVEDAVERLVANLSQPEAVEPAARLPEAPAGERVLPLSAREREVLRHLASGISTRQIARAMGVSVSTVRNHVHNVLAKLKVHSRLEAVLIGLRKGLI